MMREYGLKMCGWCGEVIPRERKLFIKLFLVVRYIGIHRFYVMDEVDQDWEHLPWYRRQKIIFVGYIEDPGEIGECLLSLHCGLSCTTVSHSQDPLIKIRKYLYVDCLQSLYDVELQKIFFWSSGVEQKSFQEGLTWKKMESPFRLPAYWADQIITINIHQ